MWYDRDFPFPLSTGIWYQGSTKFRLNLESAMANCRGTLLVTRNYPKTQSAKLPRALLRAIRAELRTEALTEHWLFRGGGGVVLFWLICVARHL